MAYRQPTSTIMICRGYPGDRDHENTLYFATKAEQWTYMASLIKYSYTAQSYQRYAKNTLRIAARADDLYDCNYLIFSNVAVLPSAFPVPPDNVQIFYCFIDSVEYINENTTEVRYTIDDLQTFWFAFKMGECYVEREHTETDLTYGNLVPENIDIKEYYNKTITEFNVLRFDEDGNAVNTDLWSLMFLYIPNDQGKYISYVGSYVTGGTDKTDPDSYLSVPTITFDDVLVQGAQMSYRGEVRNKMYVNAKYVFFHLPPITASTASKIKMICASIESRMNAAMSDAEILSVVCVPRIFAHSPDDYDHPDQWVPPDASGATVSKLLSVSRQTSLKGPNNATYTPRNKKLLSYPFNSLIIDNNAGEQKQFAWEYIDGIGASIYIRGVVAGAPEIVAFPSDYQGESSKYTENGVFIKDFVNTIWSSDSYSQFLNDNRNSITLGLLTSAIGTVAGAAMGSGMAVLQGASNITSNVTSLTDRKSTPDKITGNISFTALRHLINAYKFSFEQSNVYLSAARRIDNYFDMYGYAIDDLKIPNIKDPNVTLRPCWNYVKTNGAVILPASNLATANSMTVDELQKIKDIFDKGVRFWMDPTKVGQYSSQDNAPV